MLISLPLHLLYTFLRLQHVFLILISSQRRNNGRTSPIDVSDSGDVLKGSCYWSLTLMAPTQEICPLVTRYWSHSVQKVGMMLNMTQRGSVQNKFCIPAGDKQGPVTIQWRNVPASNGGYNIKLPREN